MWLVATAASLAHQMVGAPKSLSRPGYPGERNTVFLKLISMLRAIRQAVIGIVASIVSVVTLLSILVAVYYILQHRRSGRIDGVVQQTGVEGGHGFSELGVTTPPGSQFSQSPGNVINKPTPYPMEKYTSRPTSPYFVQPTPNNHALDRYQQMQSLNAATADLDQILNASVFTSNGGNRARSPTLSPSTLPSWGAQRTGSWIRAKEQPQATIPVSPLSSTSNFRDSIIPASYTRTRNTGEKFGTGGGRDRTAARRSSLTVIISEQDVIHLGGRDGRSDPYH
jgi:hypothetical protein